MFSCKIAEKFENWPAYAFFYGSCFVQLNNDNPKKEKTTEPTNLPYHTFSLICKGIIHYIRNKLEIEPSSSF